MKHPILVTIITSLLSGLLGVFVSSIFYSNLEAKKIKIDTAKRLIGYRYDVNGEGFSRALNEAIIIFADNEEVVRAIGELHTAAATPGKPNIDDKLLSLLKAVCKDIDAFPKNVNDTVLLKVFNKIEK